MRIRFAIITTLLAFAGGCSAFESAGTASKNVVDAMLQRPKGAAAKMENPTSPDLRREGLNELADRDWGLRPPYTTRYAQIAKDDADYTVRAAAVRALNRARSRDNAQIFLSALRDPSDLVRIEGAKALANMPDQRAVPDLLAIVTDVNQNRDLRIAAANALRHFKSLEVARTLAGQLGGRDFGVAWQSHESLRRLSSRDFRYNESRWLQYITGPDKPFG